MVKVEVSISVGDRVRVGGSCGSNTRGTRSWVHEARLAARRGICDVFGTSSVGRGAADWCQMYFSRTRAMGGPEKGRTDAIEFFEKCCAAVAAVRWTESKRQRSGQGVRELLCYTSAVSRVGVLGRGQ